MSNINPYKQLGALLKTDKTSVADSYVSAQDFVFKYAYTLDPHDKVNPIKHFPDKIYLRKLVDVWLEEPLLLIVKSRQMMISWLLVALNTWLAMFHKGQYVFFISKKEDDSGLSSPLSLLSRAYFIYNHLPESMKIPIKKSGTPAMLAFHTRNSIIHAVSQDSDALRQYTASSIFTDEMAFQERSELVYAAVKPTIDGGGRLTGVSTPNGKRNLFYKLVFDVKE
jgi:phage FluMu gp28-like protein